MRRTRRFESTDRHSVNVGRASRRRGLRLALERLEARHLLAGGIGEAWAWFETFDHVPRISSSDLVENRRVDSTVVGPRDLEASEWIVQLTEESFAQLRSVSEVDQLVDHDLVDFSVIAGLGSPGLVLLRGRSASSEEIHRVLSDSLHVESYAANGLLEGQAAPNDGDFAAGLLSGLEQIDAPGAWDVSRGSTTTVIGVVDTGIDPTHPDLYLNIWLNQGEIPNRFLDDEGPRLVDIDQDGLITFYDLNNVTVSPVEPFTLTFGDFRSGPNAPFVRDLNNNARIDALDLLEDPNWADGFDTDGNTFFDDLFGVNFRAGAGDPFPRNNPSDELGHGTHVSGTLGAIGNNELGVVGVNWQTSLMSLRILDNDNKGDSAAAISAVNYGRQMRDRLRMDDNGRVKEGANVRVLNNSWGQPGGFDSSLEASIQQSDEAGILFVAAAGNGNILGEGVDNDRTPFYPASYEVDNVIAVSAADAEDRVARFSNFGSSSVDLLAPGVGIRSTVPNRNFQLANGTSMATPHVAGTAALIWSAFPEATVDEVRQAILSSVDPVEGGEQIVSTGGRLNAAQAIRANVFAPSARLIESESITELGVEPTEFTVEYRHRNGIDLSTLGDDDLTVVRDWGTSAPLSVTLKPGSVALTSPTTATATYLMDPPGTGTFQNNSLVAIDSGEPNTISSDIFVDGISEGIGNITVSLDIEHSFASDLTATLIAPDGTRATLFSGVGGAQDNFTGTILSDSADVSILSGAAPFTGTFRPQEPINSLVPSYGPNGVWTLEVRDDFSVDGGALIGWSISFEGSWDALDFGDYLVSTVAGNVRSTDGAAVEDRPAGDFNVRISSDSDPSVLYVDSTADSLQNGSLRNAILAANSVAPEKRTIILDRGVHTIEIPGVTDTESVFGASLESLGLDNPGGWSDGASGDFDVLGNITLIGHSNDLTVIDAQGFDRIFKVHPDASLDLVRLTFQGGVSPVKQSGGGVLSLGELRLHRTIGRSNTASNPDESQPIFGGAIAAWAGTTNVNESWITDNDANFGGGIYFGANVSGGIQRSTLSENRGGGFEAAVSTTDITVANSTFSANVHGRGAIARVPSDGFVAANESSGTPSVSRDGRFVAFDSFADNLVPGDTRDSLDVFVFDRQSGTIEIVSIGRDGQSGNDFSASPSISGDGRFVAFESGASNLVDSDDNGVDDIYLFDRQTGLMERISESSLGAEANDRSSEAAISRDGRFVTFISAASNLVPDDDNEIADVFVYDRVTRQIERVSVNNSGIEANALNLDPSISGDGRFVTFESDATNLVPNDNNNSRDIFVYDRQTETVRRISVSTAGLEANGSSFNPAISADGTAVAFDSLATNLVPGDDNFERDVFVYDLQAASIQRIALDGSGASQFSFFTGPSISDDGSFVAFSSDSNILVAGDDNDAQDIFVFNRSSGEIELVSVSDFGLLGNNDSFEPSISGDGQVVAFSSRAGNLVPGDINPDFGSRDVFVHDRNSSSTDAVTYRPSGNAIDVQQVTIAFTDDRNGGSSATGDLKITDSLFVGNAIADLDIRSTSMTTESLFSDSVQTDLITPLIRVGFQPPVHRLLLGNPAIDAGIIPAKSEADQSGRIRIGVPDLGSVETTVGEIRSTVYVDNNANGQFDFGEPGLSDIQVFLRSEDRQSEFRSGTAGELTLTELPPGRYDLAVEPDQGLPWSVFTPEIEAVRNRSLVGNGRSSEPSISRDGRFITFNSSAKNLVDDDNNEATDVFVFDRETKQIVRASVNNAGEEASEGGFAPEISGNGRFVAFESRSDNLIANDNNAARDIFVYDRETRSIERVSVDSVGIESNSESSGPSINDDGRFVAFSSAATNLIFDDNNNTNDIFVFDRLLDTIERVSVGLSNAEANSASSSASISGDGRFVAFVSQASNLVVGDNNNTFDIFVHDRQTSTTERISVNNEGTEANASSFRPAISQDGRFVTFDSSASNLVDEDDNNADDTFVFDRDNRTIQRVSENDGGIGGNSFSASPSVSDDGRFVAFDSFASNLIDDDTNGHSDAFVLDRWTNTLARISLSAAGSQSNEDSFNPVLSGDGRFIAFDSRASNLIRDINLERDIFVVANPLADPGVTIDLSAGEVVTDIAFGLVPDPGSIRGRVFEDSVANEVFDAGEPVDVSAIVYLDLNDNQTRDDNEPFTEPNDEGFYEFANIDSFRNYRIRVEAPVGFEQIAPGVIDELAWSIFLPAGGHIGGRDFALRRVVPTGQSSASAVSGRLYQDKNGNQQFDQGVDIPFGDREIYLDITNFGQRDSNEPRVLTEPDGTYTISGLTAQTVAVTTSLDETFVHVTPLGSDFQLQKFPLFDELAPFGNPQAISTSDFDGDGFQDVAVILAESSQLSIRLNDQAGGFRPEKIDIDLGADGSGPTSLVIGQFDTNDQTDVAITANFSGTVVVLLNFDADTGTFESQTTVPVGEEPIDLIAGQFGGNAALDLVVVNKGNSSVVDDESLQVLTNDGAGVFTAGPAIATGGKNSVSIVAGQFTEDTQLDVAVVHSSPLNNASPNGGVTVLRGDGASGLTLVPDSYVEVGALPTDSVVSDFDGDSFPDIAVANFSSNSISILRGQGDGTFAAQSAILGTASGALDIAVGDIDNDGDQDVIASNLLDRDLSIFRNSGIDPTNGNVSFEPGENRSLGRLTLAQRMPLVVANFDNDTSAPDGEGTIDILAIPQQTDTIHVLANSLVNGARRVELTGRNQVGGLDFIIQPATLPPSLDPIEDPPSIDEDDSAQSITLTGIAKGRENGPDLRFEVDSDPGDLVSNIQIAHTPGSSTATLQYTPQPDRSGTSVITVSVIDAGANGVFETDAGAATDDVSVSQSFTITVDPINDPPVIEFADVPLVRVDRNSGPITVAGFIRELNAGGDAVEQQSQALTILTLTSNESLFANIPTVDANGDLTLTPEANVSGTAIVTLTVTDDGETKDGGVNTSSETFAVRIADPDPTTIVFTGDGNTFFLDESQSSFDAVQVIDIRGTGDNTLVLDAERITETFENGTVQVISDPGDAVQFENGWQFTGAERSANRLVRQFKNGGATLNLVGPNDFTNPIDRFDVNASGDVTAGDALQIINELARRVISQSDGTASGAIRGLDELNLGGFRFFDINADARITAVDALQVINQLSRAAASSEGEQFLLPSETVNGMEDTIADIATDVATLLNRRNVPNFAVHELTTEALAGQQSDDGAIPKETHRSNLDEPIELLSDQETRHATD